MGYTTDFTGKFKLNKQLAKEDQEFLTKLANTRRMKRNLEGYGIEGEFYVDGGGFKGQDDTNGVVDHNRPPSTQPGLWCQWVPSTCGNFIEWDEGEKFYRYVEWLEYIIKNFLTPKGYVLNGSVDWKGENHDDTGTIIVANNIITVEAL